MKIVVDLQSGQNGSHNRGIGRYALAMTRALVRNGRDRHTFRILLSDRFPARIDAVRRAFADLLEPHEIVVGAVPEHVESAEKHWAWRTRSAEVVWANFIASFQPDAYFTPSLFEGFWEDAVTSIEPAAYTRAATIHDLIPLADPEFYLVGEGSKRAYGHKINALRRCDFLFSVSEYSKKDAVDRLGLDPQKIFVMPLGVEREFHPAEVSEERRAALLRQYRLRGRFVINTSPYEARKNIPGLIAGFASVPVEDRAQMQLVIAGKMDAYARNEIATIAQNEGLKRDDVVLPGFVPDEDLIDLYRLCEVMVFPPFSEGFGLPPLEAMACGAAVLASSATSVPEVMGGREDVLFDPTAPGDIGRAIRKVLTNPDYRDELRAFGLRQAATFSWDRSAQGILRVLENAPRRDTLSEATPVAAKPTIKLAVVVTGGIPHSRESRLVKDYVRRLSAAYDVTLFNIDGDLGQDVSLPLDRRNRDDFIVHGGAFDKALYILDSSRVDIALPLMAARPGALILYERLEPTDPANLSDSQVADLRVTGGLRDLGAYREAKDVVAWKKGAAASALAHGLAVEADSAQAGDRGVMIVAPWIVPLSASAPELVDFRRARGIPVEAELWAAFVDDRSAHEVLRRFREQRQAADDHVWLVLIPVGGSKKEGPLPGRVYVMPNGVFGPYAEVMGAASAILIDDNLPASTRRRLEDDALVFGLERLSSDFETPAHRPQASEAQGAGQLRRRDWSPAQDAEFLASVERILEATPPPLAASAEILRRLPPLAGDRRPESGDLHAIATAMARNAEWERTGRLLIDVTATMGETSGNLSSEVRRCLKGLLTADPDVVFVATDGVAYSVAAPLMNALLGVKAFRDEDVQFRRDDFLVTFDLLDGDTPTDAVVGVRRVHLQVADLIFDRPDLTTLIADALAEAVRAEMSGAAAGGGPLRRSIENGVVHVRVEASNKRARGKSRGLGKAAAALTQALASPPTVEDSRLSTAFTIQGHVWGSYSLAIVNRRLARVLSTAYPGRVDFAPVETTPVTDLSAVPEDERPLIESLLKPAQAAKFHAVISQHYPIQPPLSHADVGVALLAWEESHLPPDFVETLNGAYDGVLAQVRTVQKALVDSGVWTPSVLTGLPADISDYARICRRKGPARTFLHVSSCFPRKGVDVLLEAWAQAFGAKDRVTLVIKTFPNPHNTIQEQVWDLSRRYPQMAPIQIISRDMERHELVDMFRDADAMVLPTRGEGYNLPALEAMAAGLPLIVTGHGGHRDFCGPAEARLLDYQFALSRSHVKQTTSCWVDPSVTDLIEALREQTRPDQQAVIERRRQCAMASALRAVNPERWSRTVADFAQALTGPVERTPVRTSWVSTWAVRCGIAEYSRFLIEQTSPEWRDMIGVVADERTDVEPDLVPHRTDWNVSFDHDPENLLVAIAEENPEAVVLQHQDGLIFWRHLATLINDSRLSSRTTVVTLHTVRSLDTLPEDERQRVIDALGRFDRVLVHTVGDMNDLKRHGLIDNVTLFPHGATRPDAPPSVIRELGPDTGPVIGCHGFFFDHKRIDNLIRAAALLKPRWPKLRLRLVNARFKDPISEAAIASAKAVAAEVGMTASIDWRTDFLPVDEIRDLLSGCDLLVLPYDETGDSVSGAVRVAMSSQTPTLTTPVKIFADLGEAVGRTPSNDPKVLAEAMAELLDSPARRTELQERMLAWLDNHDWKRMAATLEGIVKALAYARRREMRSDKANA